MKKCFVLLIVVFLLFSSTLYGVNHVQTLNPYYNDEVTELQAVKILLTTFVYENSTKIGIKDACQTVEAAFMTKYPILILSICKTESQYYPRARSCKGAMGIGQIMDLWVDTLIKNEIITCQEDLFIAEKNIKSMEFILDVYFKMSDEKVIETLRRYYGLGEMNYDYLEQIINDYYYLTRLTRKYRR